MKKATKKLPAKKANTKSTVAKKTAAKKTAAKKTAAKKASAKKTITKKVAAKKAVIKKTSAKKISSKIQLLDTKFSTLLTNYPTENREDLFTKVLGGGFIVLVDDTVNYKNTCAMRISVMLNGMGGNFSVPKAFGVKDGSHKDKNSKHIIVRVLTAFELIKANFNEPSFTITKTPGTTFDTTPIKNKKGILMYHADFTNARGHIDLWTGSDCHHDCPFDDMKLAKQISFWEFS